MKKKNTTPRIFRLKKCHTFTCDKRRFILDKMFDVHVTQMMILNKGVDSSLVTGGVSRRETNTHDFLINKNKNECWWHSF